MKIKLNQKIIKERCGTVSYKRGEAFYRANKVTFGKYNADSCEATVTGTEEFYVTINRDGKGNIHTTCSCPKLNSFQKDCQHIAAVLLSVYENQRLGTSPISLREQQTNPLTEGLLTLFNDQPIRSSGQQLHFENRQVLDVEFTCQPITISQGQYMFGIQLKIGPIAVGNILYFLEDVKEGKPSNISPLFTYDPKIHCFANETDEVIQQLIQVIRDEKMVMNQSELTLNPGLLLIPPSSWEQLIPFLTRIPTVKLEYDGRIFNGISISDDLLPLQFELSDTEGRGYYLKIKGLNQMIVLDAYRSVLFEGKMFQLKREDFKRLSDLNKMLDASGTNQIPIHKEQMNYFLDKVVPGLKKLGDVTVSRTISEQFEKIPLVAKLYLDRVSNRLLAGLEFHYDNVVINPLDTRDQQSGSMLIRDIEKENVILKLMEDSSFAITESGYFLHNEELEYEFLYHIIPRMQGLVQIYATTAVKNRIYRGNNRPMVRVKVKKERVDWLEFKFEMGGIPEQQIREVLLALEEKRKYYRLPNGSLLSLETRDFENMNHFLNALPIQKEDVEAELNVPIIRSFPLLDFVHKGELFTHEESFSQFLENLQHPEKMKFEVPSSVAGILRDYQKHGYKWMKTLASFRFGGILADDMGLGKTLQSITFILSELADIRAKKRPVLIICPASLTYNWLSEIMKFAPDLSAVVMDGKKADREKIQKDVRAVDVVITSYPLLLKDIKWYEKQAFHTVFFDEAQAFKNPVTQTARAVKKIQADYRFALTGTPVENSLEELWSIFHVVFPELFQGLKEYSQLTRKTIARRIRPFLLRRLKEDVLPELPEKIELTESVELLPDQKKLYAAYLAKLRHDTLKHLDKDTFRKNRIKILAGITRLRQICCHPALFVDGYKGSSAKFEQLLQIIEEAKLAGRRVLIFSQFTKMLQHIGRELSIQGRAFFYLDGQTPSEERVALCNRFNAGERDVFLISLKAGGTGLNLTGADTVILYDIWWNPAVESQAADRAYRMGQTNTVQVIKLIARGTIEDKMNELQDKKRNLVEEIIDSREKTSFTLTEDDIREILMI